MKTVIPLFILFFSVGTFANNLLSDERTFLLYEKAKGLGSGASCSGVIAELDGIYYGFTNAHCIEDVGDCNKFNLIRNYSDTKGANALLASNWTDWADGLIEDGTFVNHSCKSLKLVNRHIDLAIFEISEPTNRVDKNIDLASFSILDFEDYNSSDIEISILGHPEGKPLESRECFKEKDSFRSLNGFRLQHSCNTVSGMSGGGILSKVSGRIVGLNSSGFASRGSGPDLSYLKIFLIDYLRGNNLAGAIGKFKDEYISLDGNLTVTYLELDSNVGHEGLLKNIVDLYQSHQGKVIFPIEIEVDDRKELKELTEEHPLDFLTVPSHIKKEKLWKRVQYLINKGDLYEYRGKLGL